LDFLGLWGIFLGYLEFFLLFITSPSVLSILFWTTPFFFFFPPFHFIFPSSGAAPGIFFDRVIPEVVLIFVSSSQRAWPEGFFFFAVSVYSFKPFLPIGF